ncbi:adenylate/guanylate cyclase domain-containing protein [Candidatus Nitrososphaera evergladensis]|uniref:adenylate/guanylate cyclase domain-containing protein n=1 Tax=Candidatus Nitrososphaera evergladensis TaxID=1459637 RepID=UPI00130DD960|nr:adenylate/guanylate cyclase domain-containing protein [Candidatus Nitrososphaera evergladensis]
MLSPTIDLKQIQARAERTIEKGVQIDLSTALCKRYLRRHANQKTSVVVLYVDIDGSTKLTQSVPSTQLALILQLFSQEMSLLVSNYGGYVLKYVGDAVIALFPAEHDVERACKNALECGWTMLEAIGGGINPALKSHGLPELGIKVSMDYGEVLVVLYGKSLENSHIDIIGSNISMAAKMLAFAPSGSIIMGMRARDNLGKAGGKDIQEIHDPDWSYTDEKTGGRYRLYRSSRF